VPKARNKYGRLNSAFGPPAQNLSVLGEEIDNYMKTCKSRILDPKRLDPQKCAKLTNRLQKRFLRVMRCEVVFQPVAGYSLHEERLLKASNPVWDKAPKGAYYKARRLANLSRFVMRFGYLVPNLTHDLVRLSINIWSMSIRHFDGLCRRIMAKIAIKSRTSPEDAERFGALTANHRQSPREFWSNRDQCFRKSFRKNAHLWASQNIATAKLAWWDSHPKDRMRGKIVHL